MKRYVSILILVIALLSAAAAFRIGYISSSAQSGAPPLISASPVPLSSPSPSTITKPDLQCQGCHASNKTLPYLGGALFHTVPHNAYVIGFHARTLRDGGKGATCLDCHTRGGDMTTILAANDSRSTIHRANIADTCGRCHGDKSVMQGSGISDRPFLSYRESVHAKAIAHGNTKAAVCTDCHNSHDILPASDSSSTIAKVNIPSTCGKCHQAETAEFVKSVHGEAVARGVSRSPACTDCHGIHKIDAPTQQVSANASIATESCAKCHEGVALSQEFGVAAGRVSSYQDSYHGLASRLGSKVVANCASCNGVHNILPSSNPGSMIHAANLTKTCGQCHVGAGENFTKGRIHLASTLAVEGLVPEEDMAIRGTRIVRWIYLPLIVFVIGGMIMHNALVWSRKAAEKRRREPRTVVRLTRIQRIQHWLLLSSFIVLVLSGFALQYPESWLAWLLGSNEFLRRILHRVAAVVMLVTGVYHLYYLTVVREGREWFMDMLPGWKDVTDLVKNLGYYLGIRRARPKIARFGYAEKAEYWAVVWGTIIMGLTGLMIWFKIGIFGFLPRWAIDVAIAIHFYEAILASLAIVVWHFYHVMFDPDVYPINWAFLDGRMSEEAYREEHGLDYERMKEAESEAQTNGESDPPANPEIQSTGNHE